VKRSRDTLLSLQARCNVKPNTIHVSA